MIEDPAAGGKCSTPHHVLPGRITGSVIEAQKGKLGRQKTINISEFGNGRRGFCFLTDFIDILVYPRNEIPRAASIRKYKHRSALHGIIHHSGFNPATHIKQFHTAIIRGHQRAFGSRHWDQKIALGILAVDGYRPGNTNRHLRHANEMLHVTTQSVGVNRVLANMVNIGAGEVFKELLAFFNNSR